MKGRFVVSDLLCAGVNAFKSGPQVSETCSHHPHLHDSDEFLRSAPSALRKSVTVTKGRFSVSFCETVEVNLLTRSHSFQSFEKLRDTSDEPAAVKALSSLKRSRSLPATCSDGPSLQAAAVAAAISGSLPPQSPISPSRTLEPPRHSRSKSMAPSPFTSLDAAELLAPLLQPSLPINTFAGFTKTYTKGRFLVHESPAASPPRSRCCTPPTTKQILSADSLSAPVSMVLHLAAAAVESVVPGLTQLGSCSSESSMSSLASSSSCGSTVTVVKKGRFVVHTTSQDVM